MYQFYFEKLEVWKDAIGFIKLIYRISRKFPDEEKFGIINQLRRASLSVSSNISEGNSRRTKKDQGYFTNIAFSSLMEALSLVIVSYQLGYLSKENYIIVRHEIEKIANKLNALHKAQMNPR